jgi:hypothetical protein
MKASKRLSEFEFYRDTPLDMLAAVYNQAARLCLAEIGFVPRFARLRYFNGVLWFPWMDDFDPSI